MRGEKSVGVSCVLCVFLHFVFQSSERRELSSRVVVRERAFLTREHARTLAGGGREQKIGILSPVVSCVSPSFAFLSTSSAYFFLIKNPKENYPHRRDVLHFIIRTTRIF